MTNPYFDPVKKHHTTKGFKNNYADVEGGSIADILRWQFNRFVNGLPPKATTPTPVVVPNLSLIRNLQKPPTLTWLGHASVLVQANGLNVLTDPIFSRRASPFQWIGPERAQPPGLSLDELPKIDVVVISHNHYDHLDKDSVLGLAAKNTNTVFLVPLGVKQWFKDQGITNVRELDWWDTQAVGGVEFTFTPVQHHSSRSPFDRSKTLWGGWAVLGTDFHWYFSGDTGYSKDFTDTRERFAARQTPEQGGGFDLALIAVGACLPRWFMQEQHVDLGEAVQIHLDLGAKRSIGVHWGTFALADDPLDLPLHDLAGTLRGKQVSEDAFFLIPVGGTRQLPSRISKHHPPVRNRDDSSQ